MSEITWIKLKTDMFDNEKIKLIEALPDADTLLVIWIKLLTHAGRANAGGYIMLTEHIPMNTEEMATIFNRQLNTVRLALSTFERYGMIYVDGEKIKISNWETHQNVEGMERARLLNAERNRKFRERKRNENLLLNNSGDVSVTSHDAIEVELDKELDIDIDIEKEIKKNNSRKQVYDESSIHFQLAERLYKKILTNNPNHKKPNLQTWANDIRLMMERDNRNEKQITYAIDWCQDNDFWMANILSVDKLRKKFDTLIMQIKKDPNKPVNAPIYKGSESDGRSNEPDTRKNGDVKLYK